MKTALAPWRSNTLGSSRVTQKRSVFDVRPSTDFPLFPLHSAHDGLSLEPHDFAALGGDKEAVPRSSGQFLSGAIHPAPTNSDRSMAALASAKDPDEHLR